MPLTDITTLVGARDYTAAHELTGFHEAIQSLRSIADDVDAANGRPSPQEASSA
ncbi:hypothetical protein [Xylophilus sp.]|uniref:hypothetical protein n=1 Tax=Xylophilus sp. TaxID=2653893 RepID=UPI002D80A4D5|nr:hypothetical protein [Xylophilus sp.]